MTTFRTGVHTIEFQTKEYLKLSDLPEKYAGAVSPVDGKSKRYKLTLPKVVGVPEYSTPANSQRNIEEAFSAFADMGAGYPKTTRVDYRFDNHAGAYADNLQLMTVLVNLIAYEGGIYDRRVFYTDGNHTITSVRCMPDKKDDISRYGVEYYDKPKQAKTDEYGNARLELRRLNMENERVQYVLTEWRDMLQSITKSKYLDMLEAHAQSLCELRQEEETAAAFVARVRSKLIAHEEQTKLYRLAGKSANHYYGGLPKWKDVKPFIDDLIDQISEALAQPLERSSHHQTVVNNTPF